MAHQADDHPASLSTIAKLKVMTHHKHSHPHSFSSVAPRVNPVHRRSSISEGKPVEEKPKSRPIYVGLSAIEDDDDGSVSVGFAVHDDQYTIDYAVTNVPEIVNIKDTSKRADLITDHIINGLEKFAHEHHFKYIGAGVTRHLATLAPNLATRLWGDLDAVPMVFHVARTIGEAAAKAGLKTDQENYSKPRPADETADSAVRKLVIFFGAQYAVRLTIAYSNQVDVDIDNRIHLIDSPDVYRSSVRQPTWDALNYYANDLKKRNIKIAFFSSTPQGGGVALMRHALIRLFKQLGVNAKWYIPQPSPNVFRITKNNHNILQGVASPDTRLTSEAADQMTEWIEYNAHRYWLPDSRPLGPGSNPNAADVIIIDDPQMPGLIPLIRKARPDTPIIYRSHIEIRSDLVQKEESPQAEVWKYLWDRIKDCDVFISHPVTNFVPADVPMEKVGLLPAATDWLDGLNKPMRPWDLQYYMDVFRWQCAEESVSPLEFPKREYIIQVARFDPSKGLHVAIDSYIGLRKKIEEAKKHGDKDERPPPQLVLCGHGAIDDPDASIVYGEVMDTLATDKYISYAKDIIVMRIGPSDQILNTLMTNARFALQLSSREGFEIKVSEALHHSKPVIVTRAGGIPLQVKHDYNGFIVDDVRDSKAVAERMYELWTNKEGVYDRMNKVAKESVPDEVGTLGNAASWLYLASELSKEGGRQKFKPSGKWINDLMREGAGQPYGEGEPRLPRVGAENVHA